MAWSFRRKTENAVETYVIEISRGGTGTFVTVTLIQPEPGGNFHFVNKAHGRMYMLKLGPFYNFMR